MSFDSKFSNLGQPNKIWVLSAINGDIVRLVDMHRQLFEKVTPGDRLVYTGNYLCGPAARTAETIDEILYFRRTLLARPGMMAGDFVYLRGIQEELWNKLLHLQYQPSPVQLIEWMAVKYPDMEKILASYGSSLNEGRRIAREGIISLTRWTSALKTEIRKHPGHDKLFSVMRRAAFTEHQTSNDNNILFVHAGLDPQLPLTAQGDNFWWASHQFSQMTVPYHPFKLVVRGFDPERRGVRVGPVAITLDDDRVLCAELSSQGEMIELLAA